MRISRKVILTLAVQMTLTGAARAQFAPNANASDAAISALTTGNVYVDPRLPDVDARALEQAAMQGNGNPHTVVKIAVVKTVTRGTTPAKYANSLYQFLNLGNNALILIVRPGPGNLAVSVNSRQLSSGEEQKLAQKFGAQINQDVTKGTAALAQATASAINGKEYRSSAGLWIVFFVVAGGIVVILIFASRRKKVILTEMRQPIDALRANVLSGIEYLDGYTDVLPKNNPDSDATRMSRQAASEKYAQAVKILDRATETTDLQRAQGLLDRAQADVQTARRALDRATGGTQNIPGDDAVRPEPLPQTEAEVSAIPQSQRGVSFFSSQPAPIGSLVPVTITVNGQSRQVLATPEEADELRQGRMPQVRSFNVNGQQVPWYDNNRYDPYNDYWRNQNSGWNGNGFLTGWLAADLINDLTRPAYYGSPYPYATDMAMPSAPADYSNSVPDTGGGFMLGGAGNYDGSSGDDSGGGLFNLFGGGGSSDNGSYDSGDSGGGFDFTSSDSGGGFDMGGGFDGGGGDS